MEFDDSRLEQVADASRADDLLRQLATAGARIRREAQNNPSELATDFEAGRRPRGVIALGPEARLVRAVLEPTCPTPFVAWPCEGLPAWVGPLDLVVVTAIDQADIRSQPAVVEAVRRGCALLIVAPDDAAIVSYASSRSTLHVPVATGDPLAAVVVLLAVLHELGLGPYVQPEHVAEAADLVAEESSPHRDVSENAAKDLALGLAEAQPLVWGGTVLAARAARRVAEALRRASGRPALAADAQELLPVISCVAEHDPFADPFEQTPTLLRPVLIILDDGSGDTQARRERALLEQASAERNVRVCVIEASASGTAVDRYVTLLQRGLYGAAWLAVGLGAV